MEKTKKVTFQDFRKANKRRNKYKKIINRAFSI